jgi:hypothetical protein
VQKIVGKIFLNDIASVSQANDEFIKAMRLVDLHDMPDDRFATDLDHGFRPEM